MRPGRGTRDTRREKERKREREEEGERERNRDGLVATRGKKATAEESEIMEWLLRKITDIYPATINPGIEEGGGKTGEKYGQDWTVTVSKPCLYFAESTEHSFPLPLFVTLPAFNSRIFFPINDFHGHWFHTERFQCSACF